MARGQEVATQSLGLAGLPAHLQGKSKTVSVGNIDSTDLIIPRVKLLQAISPECEQFEKAKAGVFWHTLASDSLGTVLRFVPIVVRKSYTLWAPRGDPRGVLARANDAIHWDKRDVFKVKPKGSAKEVIWSTESGTVDASGLAKFGSAIPDNPDSQPAASLTYQILAYFPEFPDLSPSLILNTRSSIKPAKNLISKIEMRPVDHYYQAYVATAVKQESPDGPFNNYSYTSDGYADEALGEVCKALYERYGKAEFRANDEADEPMEGSHVGTDTGPGAKF